MSWEINPIYDSSPAPTSLRSPFSDSPITFQNYRNPSCSLRSSSVLGGELYFRRKPSLYPVSESLLTKGHVSAFFRPRYFKVNFSFRFIILSAIFILMYIKGQTSADFFNFLQENLYYFTTLFNNTKTFKTACISVWCLKGL